MDFDMIFFSNLDNIYWNYQAIDKWAKPRSRKLSSQVKHHYMISIIEIVAQTKSLEWDACQTISLKRVPYFVVKESAKNNSMELDKW